MANPLSPYPHGNDTEVRSLKKDIYDREESATYGKLSSTTGREEVDAFVTPGGATATLGNGAETAVSAVAVPILAANANRKAAIVQNTGTANIRVGVAGVTVTTGLRLLPDGVAIYEEDFVPTQTLFAIREGGSDSVAFTQEIV